MADGKSGWQEHRHRHRFETKADMARGTDNPVPWGLEDTGRTKIMSR